MKKLFVVDAGKTIVLENQSFDNEKLLQDVLERFPEFIALDDLCVSEPFFVIGREVSTSAGFIDVLCMDGEGVLTVIETKLARNSQIRREVIGQVLEYVAQVSKWRAQEVFQAADKYFQATGESRSLYDMLKKENDSGEVVPEIIYDQVDNNLRKGKIKVVIASDTIPENLKDTVNFINSYSNFDIYVLQIQSFKKDDLEIYAPTVFGFARKTVSGVANEQIPWDEERFFNALENTEKNVFKRFEDIYDFTRINADEISWGKGKVEGSFTFMKKKGAKKVSVYSVYTSGNISLNFGSMKNHFSEDDLRDFLSDINRLPETNISEFDITDGKFPSIKIDSLLKEDDFDLFKSAVRKIIGC